MADLMHCIYTSAAAQDFSPAELTELLEVAQRNNERMGVTGILLSVEGNFFQVLEGEPAAVRHIYDVIGRDSRHTHVTMIISESIARRDFSDWSMGFLDLSEAQLAEVLGAKDFFDWKQSLEPMANGRARKLLNAFCEGRWRTKLSAPSQLTMAAG